MPQDTLLPPGADSQKAEKYVSALCDLISQDKITVTQTDLSRFNSSSMEDHYRVNLADYDVELSHNRNPETSEETFIMIFNSISRFDNAEPKPLILSYMHLTNEQYLRLKEAADGQVERKRQKEEEERFQKNMEPVDSLLDQLKSGPPEPSKVGKPEDFLANAQPVSSAPDWNTNLTPQAEIQPDPNPVEPEPEVVSPDNPQPETPNQTDQTAETPAETASKDSSLPL